MFRACRQIAKWEQSLHNDVLYIRFHAKVLYCSSLNIWTLNTVNSFFKEAVLSSILKKNMIILALNYFLGKKIPYNLALNFQKLSNTFM